MGNRKLLNRIMVYDVYLRQLVTLAVEKEREYRQEKKPAIKMGELGEE